MWTGLGERGPHRLRNATNSQKLVGTEGPAPKTSSQRNQKAVLGPHHPVHPQPGFSDSFAPSHKKVSKSMEPGPGKVNDP